MPEETNKEKFNFVATTAKYGPSTQDFTYAEPMVSISPIALEETVRKVVKEEMESFTSRIEQAIRTAHMTQYVVDMDFAISSSLSAEEMEKRIRFILEKDRATMVAQITRMLNGGL
jgi:hypothetical protein